MENSRKMDEKFCLHRICIKFIVLLRIDYLDLLDLINLQTRRPESATYSRNKFFVMLPRVLSKMPPEAMSTWSKPSCRKSETVL